MEYTIEPNKRFGPVRLGMSREEVRQAVGKEATEFQRSPSSPPADSFDELGLMVYYKPSGECEAVELAASINGVVPILDEQELFDRPFSELRSFFEERDRMVEVSGDGLTSYKLGVGLYAPAASKAPQEAAEGVIVFEQGYYS